jgi:intracellular multiplication protein IcmO
MIVSFVFSNGNFYTDMQNFRGIEAKHEHAANLVARDTRPLGTRFAEFLANPTASFAVFLSGVIFCLFFPESTDILFIIASLIFIFVKFRIVTLPFKLPQSSGEKDYNYLYPDSYKPRLAAGISFFGNEINSKQELWFNNDDLRTHILIFGSTGSGKTESLISIAFNSLIHGSGFIYIDGKGDNSLFAKVFSMVRSMGREDDLLIINFMTGARDVIGPQTNKLSNTMNPFANGSSSMLSQLVISLMDSASSDQTGDMWKGRAINFVESLMAILCAMRDAGHILLDANSIRNYFILEKLESIVVDLKFPINDNLSVAIDHMPSKVIDPLKNYIFNLPGYNPKNKFNQAGEVREQHGFITMQLTRVFGSLADAYGHIIRTNLAEVDVKDVVLNRRILVVLLPALEKSPEELSNLGKVIIASLKAMMASGLGDQVEGKYIDVISSKPTNSNSPFVCIMDEYGYYAVKGFAIVAAQARSLGFSAVFAGQDLPAFQKASKEEAASIGANCNIKICMKLEDPLETWDYFNKSAGESYVTNVSGFQLNPGSVALNYLDTKNTSVDKKQRIELLDLKDQREGEAHLFFKSKIIRAKMFYANPRPVTELKVNQLLKVDKPDPKLLIDISTRINNFTKILSNMNTNHPKVETNKDIACIHLALLNCKDNYNPIEKSVSAMATLLELQIKKHLSIDYYYESNSNKKSINIFTAINNPSNYTKKLLDQHLPTFSQPLIKASNLLETFKQIEYLSGANITQAEQTAKKILSDIEQKSSFPAITPPNNLTIDTILTNKRVFLSSLNDILMLFNLDPIAPSQPTAADSTQHTLPNLPDLDKDKNLNKNKEENIEQ